MEAGRSRPWPKLLKAMTGDRELSADAVNQYFDPLFRWLSNYRKRHGYPVGWGEEDLSAKVLHRKAGKFEPGQGRSGILKTNNKGMSLSINIPSSLTGGKSASTKNDGVEQKGEDDKISIPLMDLAKLLSSGENFSVTSSETNANSKDGTTTINNKEFNLSTEGETSSTPPDSQNNTTSSNSTQNSSGVSGHNATNGVIGENSESKTNWENSANGVKPGSANMANGTSSNVANNASVHGTSEKQSALITNNSTMAQSNQSAAGLAEGRPESNSTNSTNTTSIGNNNNNSTSYQSHSVEAPSNEKSKPVNESLDWQAETLKNHLNTTLNNAENSTANDNTNSTTENAATRQNAPCKESSTSKEESVACNDNLMETISISPAKLIQHVLMKKVKNLVQKTLPQANVEKTNNGFTVNLDLNPKDEIPASQVQTSKTRQQHVNVFIAPKGVVVKPKSSEQLMKPSFVPVQNKDNLELRGGK